MTKAQQGFLKMSLCRATFFRCNELSRVPRHKLNMTGNCCHLGAMPQGAYIIQIGVDKPSLGAVPGDGELQVRLLRHQPRQLLDRVLRRALCRLESILHNNGVCTSLPI